MALKAILTGILMFAASGTAAAQQQVGAVQTVQQDAYGQNAGGQRAALAPNDNIISNETLITDATGLASVNFLDGSVLRLASNSSVVVDKFVYDVDGSPGQLVARLSKGVFRFVTGEVTKSGVELRTPVANIGVRGTILLLSVATDGTSRVECVEGQVSVLPNGQSEPTVLNPGQAVTVRPGGSRATDTLHLIPSLETQFASAAPAVPSSAYGYRSVSYGGETKAVAGSDAPPSDIGRLAVALSNRVPGGIILDSNPDQDVPVKNVKYDQATNSFSADGWTYSPPVSRRELHEIFTGLGEADLVFLDIVTNTGSSTLAVDVVGVPKESLVASRMIVADNFLGGMIAKGFQYLTPLYKMVDDYEPVTYSPVHGSNGHQFAALFDFKPNRFKVVGGKLVSGGRVLTAFIVPVKLDSDGVRHFDFDALSAGIQDPGIKRNDDHLLKNIGYYGKERAVRAMYAYAEVADFARLLRHSGINIDSFWSTPPAP